MPHKEVTIRRGPVPDGGRPRAPRQRVLTMAQHPPDTAQQLLETAWRYCGAIQAIIDRLNEAGCNTEPRLLANRVQRLAFRATPVSSGK
jgi:hypothetical protein